jgi:NurA-like 5'-3' nuclease
MQIGALMLESLLELALAKKEEIRNKLEDFYASGPDTDKYWVNYSFKENKQETTISAGDGSINKKKFLSFVFYAISAETLIYDTKLEKIESSQMDIMPHHRFVEDRLRNYMSIYELKSALKSLKLHNPDYYLFDGSILGNLIRPIPLDRELDNNLKDKIKSLYMDRLKNELDSGDVEISSPRFENEISESFRNKTEATIYLENLENLLVISKLLKNGKKIVGISKTSTRDDYFNFEVPDMALFDRNHRKQGYSKPIPVPMDVAGEVKRDFPVENDFFRSLTFTIFYARLEDNKNLLKFELPYRADENEIKELLSRIKSTCVEGYPYLLKKAHNDVVIKKIDMIRLMRIMGFIEKDGREML